MRDYLLGVLSSHVYNRIVLPNEMIMAQRKTEGAGQWYICARGCFRRGCSLPVVEGSERVLTAGGDFDTAFPCTHKLGGATFFSAKTTWFYTKLCARQSSREYTMKKNIPQAFSHCSRHIYDEGYAVQHVRACSRGYRICRRAGT